MSDDRPPRPPGWRALLRRAGGALRPGAGLRHQLNAVLRERAADAAALTAERDRARALEEELRDTQASLLRLSEEHSTLRERSGRLLAETTADTDRSIAAIEAAIAATQSSLFWRIKRKLRRVR